MLTSSIAALNAFRRDTRGSIIPTFAIMFFFLAMTMGAAVDAARLYHSQSRLGSAADSAAIAAAKALLDGRNSDADVERIATEYFYANLKESEGYAKIHSFVPKLDRTKNSVEIDIQADVPMTITRIAGFDTVSLPVSSVAIFDQKDIEISLALDVTGSMCSPCSKIDDLKTAVGDLLDIMLPDAGTPNKVRVGLAPYAAGVNAGSFARAATDNRSGDGCTFERQGSQPEGDQAPSVGNYLKVTADVDSGSCASAKVVALSADKDLLRRTVNGYNTHTTTAGHLGAQWASYLVSPNWGGVFGGESVPAAYNDGKTIKAAVLMTDGENNTFNGQRHAGDRARSDNLVREICSEMRTKNVMVFTVGFTGPGGALDNTAQTLLKDCAADPSHFFLAKNRDELRQAFASIANQLNNLRLSK